MENASSFVIKFGLGSNEIALRENGFGTGCDVFVFFKKDSTIKLIRLCRGDYLELA